MCLKKIGLPFIAVVALYSCSKSPETEEIVYQSYPGALDSVSVEISDDSASYSQLKTMAVLGYDDQRRVRKIVWPSDAHVLQTNYFYNSNDRLPYLSVDTSYYLFDANGYTKTIQKNLYTYDNQQRLINDSMASFYLLTEFNHTPIGDLNPNNGGTTYVKEYGSNYVTTKDKNIPQIYNHGVDTFFFNGMGDINYKKPNMQNGYFDQRVTEFHTTANPFSQLNIHPLYDNTGRLNGTFGLTLWPLDFVMMQPKFLFKKLSGRNEVFHTSTQHDITEVNLYVEKDINGRAKYLVLVRYEHQYSYNGIYLRTAKWFCNYQFHYHQ